MKVLIVDYENWDSVASMPRLFKDAGYVVDIYSPHRSWLSKSWYFGKHFIAPIERSAYAAGLKVLENGGAYDWVVLGDDMVGRIVAEAAEGDPTLWKLAPLVKNESRAILGSKAELSLACTREGILTPTYELYDPAFDAHALAAAVTFPLVVKVDKSAGGSGVFMCRNTRDVDDVLCKLGEDDKKKLVFQKYIDGDNVAVETLYKNGELLMYAHAVVTKTLAGEFGISSERKYSDGSDIEEQLKYIGRSLGLHGFCSMTFMRNAAEYYLVEADLRPQSWYSLASLAGIDFSQGIKEFFSSTPKFVPMPSLRSESGTLVRHFERDIRWCLREREYVGLLHWCYGKDGRWRAVPWREPRILGRIAVRGMRYSLKRIYRRAIALLPINP